jgi:hypothetical protein
MLWYNLFGIIRHTDSVGERPRGMGYERVDCTQIFFGNHGVSGRVIIGPKSDLPNEEHNQ